MSSWRRALRRPRLFDEASFALGGALIWAGAATAVVAIMQVTRAPEAGANAWFEAGAQAFGFGWLGGLFWCSLLALQARSRKPTPPVAALPRATWLAVLVGLLVLTVLFRLGVSVGWAVAGCVVAATVVGRAWVATVAAREAQ
jgi:hypothetical protein